MHGFYYHGWLRRDHFCSLKGLTPRAFDKVRPKLQIQRLNYYTKRAADGCEWVHYERFDEWVEKNNHLRL